METLTMTGKVSEDGKLLFKLPSHLSGATVDAVLHVKEPENTERSEAWPVGIWKELYHLLPPSTNDPTAPPTKKLKPEEVDQNGWPIGFFEKFVGCITDPAFRRYPQGEPDPVPPFE